MAATNKPAHRDGQLLDSLKKLVIGLRTMQNAAQREEEEGRQRVLDAIKAQMNNPV